MPIFLCLPFVATLPAATLDGIQIHSSVSGKGTKTVILVHGWTCDETSWQSQVAALAGIIDYHHRSARTWEIRISKERQAVYEFVCPCD